jgi:hypothetical protein
MRIVMKQPPNTIAENDTIGEAIVEMYSNRIIGNIIHAKTPNTIPNSFNITFVFLHNAFMILNSAITLPQYQE